MKSWRHLENITDATVGKWDEEVGCKLAELTSALGIPPCADKMLFIDLFLGRVSHLLGLLICATQISNAFPFSNIPFPLN